MSQQDTKDMAKYFYRASAADFMKVPGYPIIYSASERVIEAFSSGLLSSDFISDGSLKTGNNDKYIRFHWEVNAGCRSIQGPWRDHPKGGDFRKWSGNRECVVCWTKESISHYQKDYIARILNQKYWDLEGISWSAITSGAPSFRVLRESDIANNAALCIFPKKQGDLYRNLAYLNSKVGEFFLGFRTQTLNFLVGDVMGIPINSAVEERASTIAESCVEIADIDWDSFETSWNFERLSIVDRQAYGKKLRDRYIEEKNRWEQMTAELQCLESENNRLFIEAYRLQDELTPNVPIGEITLTRNPFYTYGNDRHKGLLNNLVQCDYMREVISYAIGCMMGRYSLDKTGLVLADQGGTLKDYMSQITSPRFLPDDDAILPLTDQEWFPDDATNRFHEFVRVVWGEEHLQENLDFVAESLCLHAIKPKRGESALDTIRRYLSTQFYKDHMRTYKKRPIYWLFSSGKHKAFECLVYLHRYNEGTLARMRTEYVIPLSAKLSAYAEKLEQDKDASSSAAETKRLEKEIATLHKQQTELAEFDEKLRHYADQRISLDLDDGVKVNYGKFGDLLAEVKAVTGLKPQ
ncbi:BREX-1 system adenine-specific DNA-methyltransferase PglX [Methylophaga sp.]|uniref:BREX-1 system adenine-specific DNA-methyltransferase PglX n=1 Tax=Methylophaga sp. TaxID=2024840 RepID=UPI003A8C8B89